MVSHQEPTSARDTTNNKNLVPHPLLLRSKRDALPRVPRRPRPRHGPSVNLEAREPLRVKGRRRPMRRARRLQIAPIDIIHRHGDGRFVGRVADLVRRVHWYVDDLAFRSGTAPDLSDGRRVQSALIKQIHGRRTKPVVTFWRRSPEDPRTPRVAEEGPPPVVFGGEEPRPVPHGRDAPARDESRR